MAGSATCGTADKENSEYRFAHPGFGRNRIRAAIRRSRIGKP
jgi:hypothetical protein